VAETLKGYFKHQIYTSPNYAVYVFESEEERITVTGPLADINKNNLYILTGEYTFHKRYGRQFAVNSYEISYAVDEEESIKLLSSNLFKGIGKKTAIKIVDKLGADCINEMLKDRSLISTLELKEKQADSLNAALDILDNPIERMKASLAAYSFKRSDIDSFVRKYEDDFLEIVEKDPYFLHLDNDGISFTKIDNYALNKGFEKDNVRRKQAILIDIIKNQTFKTGDTYLEKEELNKLYYSQSSFLDYEDILEKNIEEFFLKQEENCIYLYREYLAEEYITSYLLDLNSEEIEKVDNLNYLIKNYQEEKGISFSVQQVQAIQNYFLKPFSMISGGPGSGKTTVIAAIYEIATILNPYETPTIVAPTGRAAKRISELCLCDSKTIHSLLGWISENDFRYNENNPLLLDGLIVDEFSMVDNQLFASLLKANKGLKHLCIIGDHNQLPSIRPGNLLQDLLEADVFPYTYLEYNFRQAQGSEIIDLAYQILKGDVDFDKYHQEIEFIESNEVSSLLEIIDDYRNDSQVIAPMYSDGLGIDNLNTFLQEHFNQNKINLKNGKNIFRVDDKVIQLKNIGNLDIYNGDIGYILDIDLKNENMLIDFTSHLLNYPINDIDNLALAYAISIHKSQGSEYDVVYLCFSPSHSHFLNTKMLYTAISRAKKKLYIIGSKKYFLQSLKRKERRRKTGLKEKLIKKFA